MNNSKTTIDTIFLPTVISYSRLVNCTLFSVYSRSLKPDRYITWSNHHVTLRASLETDDNLLTPTRGIDEAKSRNRLSLHDTNMSQHSIASHTSDAERPDADADADAPALLLTVRFSASIPDLLLDITTPATTTSAGLKQLIRAHLPSELSAHRLRLIYAGRGLEDATPLTTSLRLPPSWPAIAATRTSTPSEKGKEPVREQHDQQQQPRLYIHCSIGDIVLSETDLAEEAATASTLFRKQDDDDDGALTPEQKRRVKQQQQKQQEEASSTTPAPRGFDRLLSAGFTAAEVTALRSQFLAVQSVSRTRDTMPSGAELRDLEDRWLDDGTTAGSGATGGLGGGGDGGGGGLGGGTGDDGGDDGAWFGTTSRGAIDDMLWGAVMGFFWPIGCAMWLRREEGVWSWRKGLAVFVGVVVNAAFGAMRIMD